MINKGISLYKVEKTGQHFNIYYKGHHFLTVINQVGTFNIRAHPGEDPNGWGTSVYVQPFFPGARLHSAVVKQFEIHEDHVFIEAEGKVCHGRKDGVGSWSVELAIKFDSERKVADCTGKYIVDLPDSGDNTHFGDTNMIRIASNYLWDVPRLDGSVGNTGDMTHVDVEYYEKLVHWTPLEETSAILWNENDCSDAVRITVHGGINSYDSVKQGFDPITSPAAIKPTIVVEMKSITSSQKINVFAMMSVFKDELASNQYGREVFLHEEYWQDNIGITPIILESSPNKHFEFEISLTSFPPE
jgi:hypothetical protein